MLRDLADGIDPRARWAEQKQTAVTKQESLFSVVAEQFITKHVAKKHTARAIELRIRNYLIKPWGNKPITEIERADVVAMVDAAVDEGHPAAARQNFA